MFWRRRQTKGNVAEDQGRESSRVIRKKMGAHDSADQDYRVSLSERLLEVEERLSAAEVVEKDKSFPALIPTISPLLIGLILATIASYLILIFPLQPVIEDAYGSKYDILHLTVIWSIPFISVVFTYFHIWAALWMTFYPVHFVGVFQLKGELMGNVGLPGWQGIVPFKAEKMAKKAVELMTTKLINVKEVFQKLNAIRVVEELGPMINIHTRELVDVIAAKYNPTLWAVLPGRVKDELMTKIIEDAPPVIAGMVEDFKENIENIVDLEELVVGHSKRNPNLLIRMFINCGYSELVFIRNCGATMGFLFGLIQLVVFFFYNNKYVVFPVFGTAVGAFTNYIALACIFKPVNPIYIGPIKLHGLFLRHQKEVSKEYGRLAARDFLNPQNIAEAIVKGKGDTLITMISMHVDRAVDEQFGRLQPVVSGVMGPREYEEMKEDFSKKIVELLPETVCEVEGYLQEALQIQDTLETAVGGLTSESFEQLLHPVFEEDEWKLVFLGGFLGAVIGAIQMTFLEG